MKSLFLLLLFCSFSYLSFSQPCNDSAGAVLRNRMAWFNTYPESLAKEKQSALIFCQLFFKSEGGLDTFYLHNTESEEIKQLFTNFINGIDFREIYKETGSVIVPFIFKDEDQLGIEFKVNGWLLSDFFRTRKSSNTVCFLNPVYVIYYYPKPPKRSNQH